MSTSQFSAYSPAVYAADTQIGQLSLEKGAEKGTEKSTEVVRLGWVLTRNKLITPPQLERALNTQHARTKKLGELLMEQHLISEDQLRDALREQTIRRRGHWVI